MLELDPKILGPVESSFEDEENDALERRGPKPIKPKMSLSIYRSVSRNMIDMLTLADRKAGLLLNANAISLTVLVSFFGRGNLNASSKLWVSSLVIAATCALTVILASLAARPIERKSDLLTLDEFLDQDLSLLHYGDIARLSREDFFRGYRLVGQDPELLERSMLSEMHFFSTRALKKFRMVRRAYLTMITGIMLSCVALFFAHFSSS